jgi:uncharacterized protein YqhQ
MYTVKKVHMWHVAVHGAIMAVNQNRSMATLDVRKFGRKYRKLLA